MATVAQIVQVLESRFPPALAEDWDVVGLSVGDPAAEVTGALFAVDPSLAVVDEAIEIGAELIVTHHPLMLRGVTGVATTTAKGAVVHRLITHGIALFSAHTNADAAAGGVCDALADVLGVVDTAPLIEVAPGSPEGTGRVGRLEAPMHLADFAQHVARVLPQTAHGVRVAGDLDGLVSTVAIVGGSGDSYLDVARASGADVYITADLRHHPASDARELAALGDGRPYLIDVSHAASEWAWLSAAAEHLGDRAGIDTAVSTLNTDPWTARYGA